jgi:hypothetical protein
MTDHPLTDDIIHAKKLGYTDDYGNWYYDEDDIRAAADWQLEQVIKWLEETECNRYNNVKIIHANDLRAAMRPQEDN